MIQKKNMILVLALSMCVYSTSNASLAMSPAIYGSNEKFIREVVQSILDKKSTPERIADALSRLETMEKIHYSQRGHMYDRTVALRRLFDDALYILHSEAELKKLEEIKRAPKISNKKKINRLIREIEANLATISSDMQAAARDQDLFEDAKQELENVKPLLERANKLVESPRLRHKRPKVIKLQKRFDELEKELNE